MYDVVRLHTVDLDGARFTRQSKLEVIVRIIIPTNASGFCSSLIQKCCHYNSAALHHKCIFVDEQKYSKNSVQYD